MRASEIITEISNAERKRQKDLARKQELERQGAELQRKQQSNQLRQAARDKLTQFRINQQTEPKSVEPESEFTKMMRDLERQQREQEDEEYGVDFKFQTVVDKQNKTQRLYGFWTRERIQRLEDVMRVRQYRDLGNFTGSESEIKALFELFEQLGKQYRQVYIFFDRENMSRFPGLRKVLERLNYAYKNTRRKKIPFGYRLNPQTNEIEQHIAWEEVDRPPETSYKI